MQSLILFKYEQKDFTNTENVQKYSAWTLWVFFLDHFSKWISHIKHSNRLQLKMLQFICEKMRLYFVDWTGHRKVRFCDMSSRSVELLLSLWYQLSDQMNFSHWKKDQSPVDLFGRTRKEIQNKLQQNIHVHFNGATSITIDSKWHCSAMKSTLIIKLHTTVALNIAQTHFWAREMRNVWARSGNLWKKLL